MQQKTLLFVILLNTVIIIIFNVAVKISMTIIITTDTIYHVQVSSACYSS
jgi:hypothetical protein